MRTSLMIASALAVAVPLAAQAGPAAQPGKPRSGGIDNTAGLRADGSQTVSLTSGVQSTYAAFTAGLNAALDANPDLAVLSAQIARLSLLLCFFNLIPIPPLDGSHVLRVLVGMSYEKYYQFARFGFLAVIIAIQMPFVVGPLRYVTNTSWQVIGGWFGVEV